MLTNDIQEVLHLDQWVDLIVGPNGYAAKRRPDIAPFAYEIMVNKPLGGKIIQSILEFAGDADSNLTRRLYSLCNGIRIGANKFGVYGVLGQIDRTSGDLAFHSPLDINIPNIYGRPKGWPESYLIVGFSGEASQDNTFKEMVHAIAPQGTIIVAATHDHLIVYRKYYSIEDWLSSEVQRALDDVERF